MTISLAWTRSMSPKEREDMEKLLQSSPLILSKFFEILSHRDREIEQTEGSIKDFEDPNWAYKQAFRNGQKAELKRIKELFSIEKD